jgi:hypothetical protein
MNFPMKSLCSSLFELSPPLKFYSNFFEDYPFYVYGEPLAGAATPPFNIDEEDI